MSPEWRISIDNQEQRRKVAMVEGRARRDDHATTKWNSPSPSTLIRPL